MIIITTLRPLFFLIILCSCVSCELFQNDNEPKTELDKLPPITQTGENTFGCLVNGEAFVVRNTLQLGAIYQQGILQMGGGIENEEFEKGIFILFTDQIEKSVPYNVSNFSEQGAQYTTISLTTQDRCEYEFSDTYEGSILFTNIDQTNFIISGIFEFSTVNEDCDTVRITDGRFDMQYTP